MKKWICYVAELLVMGLILCGCGGQEASPVEDFTYEMIDGEVTITGYIGTDFDIVIPSVINERPVTVIGEEAFREYDLKTIVLPETIKRINEKAFYDCVLLEKIELPNKLSFLGFDAFCGCTSLETITLPDNVEFDERSSYADDGAYYIIWSPFDDKTTVYVSEGSKTLERLRENEDVLDTHFSIMKSFYINYTVK